MESGGLPLDPTRVGSGILHTASTVLSPTSPGLPCAGNKAGARLLTVTGQCGSQWTCPYHPCNIWIPPSCPFLLLLVLVVLAWIGLISAPEPSGQWRRGAYRSQQSNESSPQTSGGKDKLLLCWGHSYFCGWKKSLERMIDNEANLEDKGAESPRKAPLTPSGYLYPAVPESSLPLKFSYVSHRLSSLCPQDMSFCHFPLKLVYGIYISHWTQRYGARTLSLMFRRPARYSQHPSQSHKPVSLSMPLYPLPTLGLASLGLALPHGGGQIHQLWQRWITRPFQTHLSPRPHSPSSLRYLKPRYAK